MPRADMQTSAPSARARAMWKPVRSLARRQDARPVPHASARESVVHARSSRPARHANRVQELERSGTCSTLAAVDGDEVGHDAGGVHRLAEGQELVVPADAQLETDRLAAGVLRSLTRNSSSPIGVENARWPGGEKTVSPGFTPRMAAISSVTFAPGRMPPWPGLAPCESLSSTIRTISRPACSRTGRGRIRHRPLGSRNSPCRPARSGRRPARDGRARCRPRPCCEQTRRLGSAVEREHGVTGECPEAHRRDVQQRGSVRLAALGAANRYSRRRSSPACRSPGRSSVRPTRTRPGRRRDASRTAWSRVRPSHAGIRGSGTRARSGRRRSRTR